MLYKKGFTIIEAMVAISIIGILSSIALPSFNHWIVKNRVDNEISQLHRLLSHARNTAINMEVPVVICPLENDSCVKDWTKDLAVFIDLNGNRTIDRSNDIKKDEPIIYSKLKIKPGDGLAYPRDIIVYQPTGQSGGYNGTFRYCPNGHPDKKRGLKVSLRGRVYASSDINNDGKDEFRNGSDIPNC